VPVEGAEPGRAALLGMLGHIHQPDSPVLKTARAVLWPAAEQEPLSREDTIP
jgi:hypothetical protein